jgi:hypothetical protein
MVRWGYTLFAFAALAAWAGAQGPTPAPPLSAEDKLRLLKANGPLIHNLVESGIQLSAAENAGQRVEKCRDAARLLAHAVRDAAAKEDAERVAELTALFREVVRDGFLPTYNDAIQKVTPGSPAAEELKKQREHAAGDVNGLKAAIPTSGKVGENARVRDELKQLEELSAQLK